MTLYDYSIQCSMPPTINAIPARSSRIPRHLPCNHSSASSGPPAKQDALPLTFSHSIVCISMSEYINFEEGGFDTILFIIISVCRNKSDMLMYNNMHFDRLIEFFYANRQQSYKWMKKKYYILFCKKKK